MQRTRRTSLCGETSTHSMNLIPDRQHHTREVPQDIKTSRASAPLLADALGQMVAPAGPPLIPFAGRSAIGSAWSATLQVSGKVPHRRRAHEHGVCVCVCGCVVCVCVVCVSVRQRKRESVCVRSDLPHREDESSAVMSEILTCTCQDMPAI
jgi:hypothetical protein